MSFETNFTGRGEGESEIDLQVNLLPGENTC